MGHVFVSRPVPGDAEQLLRESGHDVTTWPGPMPAPRDELLRQLAGADAVLSMLTERIDGEAMRAAPGLKVASNMAVGYDNIDVPVATELGVWATNTPGVLAETTADFAFALLLGAARNVSASERDTRAGGWKTWSPTAFLGPDVHGATLGIVGLGEIGTEMAKRARGFGMRILYSSRTRKPDAEAMLGVEHVPFETLLAESDFVSLHTPLTDETRHLMDGGAFGRMKRTAILVNTARGPVVDQEALVAALREGTIAGAAIDVTTPEPLPLDHELYALPNLLITPHIASASVATRSKMAEMAAQNIIAVLAGGEPPNALNRPGNPR